MAHATRIARARHLGQAFQQARNLLGGDLGMPAKLVKGGRDQG
ncbi:hypothetical protein [Streptomyces sp. LN785]